MGGKMFNLPVQMGVDIATSLSVIFACFVFIINQIKERKVAHQQRELERLTIDKIQQQKDFDQALVFVSKGYVKAYDKLVQLVNVANKASSLKQTENFHPGKLIYDTFNEIILTANELNSFNDNLIIPFLEKCNAREHLEISRGVSKQLEEWNAIFIKAFVDGNPEVIGKMYSDPIAILGKSIVAMYTTKFS